MNSDQMLFDKTANGRAEANGVLSGGQANEINVIVFIIITI